MGFSGACPLRILLLPRPGIVEVRTIRQAVWALPRYLRDPRPASSSAAYRLTPFLRTHSSFPVDTTPVLHVFGTAGRDLSMAERLTATRPLLEKVRRIVFRPHGR
jgi:hypothetical protein